QAEVGHRRGGACRPEDVRVAEQAHDRRVAAVGRAENPDPVPVHVRPLAERLRAGRLVVDLNGAELHVDRVEELLAPAAGAACLSPSASNFEASPLARSATTLPSASTSRVAGGWSCAWMTSMKCRPSGAISTVVRRPWSTRTPWW